MLNVMLAKKKICAECDACKMLQVLTLASKGRQIFKLDVVRTPTFKVIVPVPLAIYFSFHSPL